MSEFRNQIRGYVKWAYFKQKAMENKKAIK